MLAYFRTLKSTEDSYLPTKGLYCELWLISVHFNAQPSRDHSLLTLSTVAGSCTCHKSDLPTAYESQGE